VFIFRYVDLPLIIVLKINYFINSLSLIVILQPSFIFDRYFKNLFCVHILFF